jgi:hypothetical protein
MLSYGNNLFIFEREKKLNFDLHFFHIRICILIAKLFDFIANG